MFIGGFISLLIAWGFFSSEVDGSWWFAGLLGLWGVWLIFRALWCMPLAVLLLLGAAVAVGGLLGALAGLLF